MFAGYEEVCAEQYDRVVGCYTDFSSPVYERSRTGLGYPKWVEIVDEYLILTWWIVGFCVLFTMNQLYQLKERRW